MKILNFGSLNIDNVYSVSHFVRAGETLASTSLNHYPGGKGLNQSVAFAKAGAGVFHAGLIGADGKMLSDLLEKVGDGATFVGDGAAAFKNKITEKIGDKALIPSENLIFQRASSIATAAQYIEEIDEKQLESIYLRMPQAERERLEKENGKADVK